MKTERQTQTAPTYCTICGSIEHTDSWHDDDDRGKGTVSHREVMRARANRSGTQWSEADYAAAGKGRLSLRLSLEALGKLEDLSDGAGCSRAEWLEFAILRAPAEE
jgi:hypothetical protein